MSKWTSFFLLTAVIVGFLFLYAPIFLLIIFSFNASRNVAIWTGFSAHWYGALLENAQILSAAWLSLKIAAISASIGVILGTMAGFALARFRRFRGRTFMTGMVAAPLVMPEVVLGLSLLLTFVMLNRLIGWPERGMITIILAHATFTLAYVAVILQSRLQSLDRSLEEAAMDLGARPWKVFAVITLPIIAPAIISGWLLAFTLSLDDVVIASFVSGPGASTLPMVVFSKVRLGVTPEINALATVIILVVASGIFLATWLMKRTERQRQYDIQTAMREAEAS